MEAGIGSVGSDPGSMKYPPFRYHVIGRDYKTLSTHRSAGAALRAFARNGDAWAIKRSLRGIPMPFNQHDGIPAEIFFDSFGNPNL